VSRGLLLCILALLLVGGWWALAGSAASNGSERNRSPVGLEAEGSASIDSIVSANPDSVSHMEVERTQQLALATDDATKGWTGRLTWPDGSPAANVVVRARHSKTDLPVCHTRSDANGRYTLALGEPFDGFKVHQDLDLSCDGYTAKDPEWPRAQPSSPFAVMDIVLERGAALEIKAIYASDGTPAAGVWINANCETDWMHEAWGLTDDFGLLTVYPPHRGPWAFMGLEPGVAIAPEATYWIKPADAGVTLPLVHLPQALHLQAYDVESGVILSQASFHGAQMPSDVREVPEQAYTELSTNLPSENGALHYSLPDPGRVFVKVKAEGYFTEVAEIVLHATEPHAIPLIPLETVEVAVTRKGKPVAAKLSIGFNRHPLLFPSGDTSEALSLQPQCAPLLRFEVAARAASPIQLPKLSSPTSPQSFDLWIESGGITKYFGVIQRDALPAQPWSFEMEPLEGKVLVKVLDKQGQPLAGVNVHLSHVLDEAYRDAAGVAADGMASRIGLTDDKGEVSMTFQTPCFVVASVSQGWMSNAAEGRLETGEELSLQIQIEKAYDPYEQENLETSGRVQFEGAMPEGLAYDALSVFISPKFFLGEYWVFLDETGAWSASIPAGTYELNLSEDPHSDLPGHTLLLEAGTQNNLLLLPSPSGLLLTIRELGSGDVLLADDVDLWVDGKWLAWMEAYADGSAGSQILFADRVEYDVEKEGYVPAFGVVELRKGVIAQHEVVLHPARTIHFLFPEGADEERFLMWLDPPQRKNPFPVFLNESLWNKAPTDRCRLQAIDKDHNPIGPEFIVQSGLADLDFRVPLFE